MRSAHDDGCRQVSTPWAGYAGSPDQNRGVGTIKRNPQAGAATSAEVAGMVVFQASNTTAPVPVDATILDVADAAGVFIDNACRSGPCGSCRVKLVAGACKMAVYDALTEQDKIDGYILACQAKIHGDVKVDA
jgi:ferredoxin